MKIFLQSSVFLPTPAPGAGAVEYLVGKLAQGLAVRGHDVTLFALEGSDVPGVEVVTVEPQGSPAAREAGLVQAMVERTVTHGWPDVLFDHSLTQLAQKVFGPTLPAVTMSHGMAPIAPWAQNVTFTSRHHARLHGRPDAQVLYNGVDVEAIPFGLSTADRQQRLVWAGRILPYKRPHVALDWAWEANLPLILAGPIGEPDYFRHEVEPRVRRAHCDACGGVGFDYHGIDEQKVACSSCHGAAVEYLGELDHDALLALFRENAALLFTSDESEPFGIVMLEAMASGCPVLAYDIGANREIVAGFQTGRLVHTNEEAVDLLKDAFWTNLSHENCRHIAVSHHSIDSMIRQAEALLTRAAAEVPA